jgi:hypothetical protein
MWQPLWDGSIPRISMGNTSLFTSSGYDACAKNSSRCWSKNEFFRANCGIANAPPPQPQ